MCVCECCFCIYHHYVNTSSLCKFCQHYGNGICQTADHLMHRSRSETAPLCLLRYGMSVIAFFADFFAGSRATMLGLFGKGQECLWRDVRVVPRVSQPPAMLSPDRHSSFIHFRGIPCLIIDFGFIGQCRNFLWLQKTWRPTSGPLLSAIFSLVESGFD